MDLLSAQEIKNILFRHQTRPSKGLGQNFLIDARILEKIIEAADIRPSDTILEVGPGIGTLTQALANKAKKVITVEKDAAMVEILKETLADFKNIEIIQSSILEYNIEDIKKYKVVANIPYYLTSPLIRKLLEEKNQPQEIVLMIQKEVAQRICARPPQMSLLAVSVQLYADPKIISYVSKHCFYPAPKIDSAIIKIVPHAKHDIHPDAFFTVAKAGFAHPRKQLVNNLATLKSSNGVELTKEQISNWLLQNNLRPTQRAETLTVSDWILLTKSLETFNF